MIWSSDEGLLVSNDGDEGPSQKNIGSSIDNGTVLRTVSIDPDVAPRNHRTDSIDYVVVMTGEIDMFLETRPVRLRAGDVLVQHGTIHNWVRTLADVQ